MTDAHDFGSSNELLKYLREKCDDIDSISIPIHWGVEGTQPDGSKIITKDIGAVINYCNGTHKMIHRTDAENIINDGVLQRLEIPIRLTPTGETLNDKQ